ARSVRQAFVLQTLNVHLFAVLEDIQRLEIDRNVSRGVARVVEAALRYATDEGHLAAFETDTDRAARTRRLAFASAACRLAVAAGFALSEPLAAVLGSRTR